MLTGMRSGEVVLMRVCDIDRSGPVWLYRPAEHKMRYRDRGRVVPIGPRAQAVLKPYLDARAVDDYLFDPREARAEREAQRRAARKTPARSGQARRRKESPKRSPRPHYTPDTYGRVIARACVAARVPHWHPHQLRHLFGTEVRQQFGLEAAQVLLGHVHARVTEVYAERNIQAATEAAARIG
jgi:integrase